MEGVPIIEAPESQECTPMISPNEKNMRFSEKQKKPLFSPVSRFHLDPSSRKQTKLS